MNGIGRWARKFGVARAVCLVLLFALIPLRLADPRPLAELRARTFDLFQVLWPREQSSRPVVIVDIDEDSLKEIGQWPWPRTTVADLITKITELGAAGIGFDIIFAEPDRMSPAIAEHSFRGIDADTRAKLDSLPSNDAVLADAIKNSRVVVGQVGSAHVDPKTKAEQILQTGFAIRGPDPTPFLVTFPGLLRNVLPIEEAAAGRGLFSINPETDGIIRRVPVIMEAQGALVPSLAMEMLRVVSHASAILVRVNEAGVQSVAVPGLEVPTDRNGQLWVHFNKHDPARYVSAKDVLQGRVPADRLRGRLVLIGTSATGLLDIKTTPLDPVIPGVEVHAQILESVLTKSILLNPNYAIGAELVIAVLLGIGVIIAAPMLSPTVNVVLGALLIAGLTGFSLYLFVEHDLLIDFTYPLISSWLIYLVLTFVNYFREQQQRQQIRSAFGYYLSPHMVEQLARSPEKLVLGGEERRMTILFSDVRGFTTISEHYKDDPQGLTRLMNRFLTPLTNAIIERKGTIDKYIGDAIMAFWNAPVDDPEQESQCLRGGAADARARRHAQRRAQARGRGQWRRVHAAAHRYRPQYRPLRGRQHGVGFPLQLFGAGRHRKSRLAARGANQGLSPAHGHRIAHRGSGEEQVRHHGNRSDPGEGQEAAGSGVHGARPRRSRAGSALYRAARSQCANAGALPQAGLGWRARPHSTLPQERQWLRRGGALRHVRRAHRRLSRRAAGSGLGRRLRSRIEVTVIS